MEGLPPGCESTDALLPAECLLFFSASHKLSVPFEQWLEKFIAETSQKPVCIISDVFLAWSAASASRFGIPLVVYHTTGAMGASLLQYLFTNPVNEIISDHEIIDICDGSLDVNLRRAELPQMLRRECFFSAYPFLSVLQQVYAAAKGSCAATLVNTLDGVEAGYMRYLVESTGKPVWPIAHPLQKPQQGVQSECMRWLDGEKQNSVLNVSFGSSTFLTEDQIKALARGIEASKQPFVWTIKEPVGSNVNSCEFLPEGFIERTRDRGMVIHGWVPLLLILSHPSTACFMSHCGWNSTLESISAGVPMVAWPMLFAQFLNAKLVTEQLRTGLQMCDGLGVIPNSDIVERTVKAAMAEEIGKEMRDRAKKIKESSRQLNIRGFVSVILNAGRDSA